MENKRRLLLGAVRICLALVLLGAAAAIVAPNAVPGRVALADKGGHGKGDKNDDDGGKKDKSKNAKHGKGNKKEKSNNGNKGHGNNGKGKKNKNDDEPVIVVVAPDVTPIPVTAVPTPTQAAEQSGSLRVVAMTCAVRPADGADWSASCTTPAQNARFDVTGVDGPMAGWHRTIDADSGGIATLDQLPPARYRLDQVRADWCHAESDRVDANGDLVVESGQTTTVWTFNCPPASAAATPTGS